MTGRKVDPDALLAFIGEWSEDHGYPPSYREIAAGCGRPSLQTVKKRLDLLRGEGRVTWVDGSPRTLRVTR